MPPPLLVDEHDHPAGNDLDDHHNSDDDDDVFRPSRNTEIMKIIMNNKIMFLFRLCYLETQRCLRATCISTYKTSCR